MDLLAQTHGLLLPTGPSAHDLNWARTSGSLESLARQYQKFAALKEPERLDTGIHRQFLGNWLKGGAQYVGS